MTKAAVKATIPVQNIVYILDHAATVIIIAYLMPVEVSAVLNKLFPVQVQSSLTAQELESYGDAGAVVEEVLNSVRTVVAFGGEDKEVARQELLYTSP